MLRVRLARRGRKNLNVSAIVVAEQSFRRDGRFKEKIGYHQPTLPNTDPFRFSINKERYDYWVSQGAQPSDKVKKLMAKHGMGENLTYTEKPKKSASKPKTLEKAEEKAKKAKDLSSAAE